MKNKFTFMNHFKHIFSAVAIFLATSVTGQTTVMDVISESPDHTSLRAAIFQEGLDVVLSDASADFTVFAPTNASFDALAAALETDLNGILALPNLSDVLTYHVLGVAVPAANVTNGAIIDAVSTTNTLKLTKTAAGSVYANQAMVVGADLTADNGVVHSVNAVLLPYETVVDVAIDNGFSTLATAIITAELMPALTDPYKLYTVFAPTNDAFDALAAALDTDLAGILALPNLAEVLLYHVVGSRVTSDLLVDGPVTTLNGSDITVDLSSGVMINDATVTTVDVFADNGVVHIIDGVLLPPSAGLEESTDLVVSVYPNPAVNSIQFEGNESYNYSIVNALGQVVSEGTTSNQNIAVSNLDNGMYTLRLNNENGSLTSKFFKK